MSDALEQFARECRLQLTAEPLCTAPRDIRLPLDAVEQQFLVTITRPGADRVVVRLIFAVPAVTGKPPAMREVLWWLAGDAWTLERSERKPESWAATYGYPPEAEATLRQFERHLEQADALAALVGETNYRRLLHLFTRALVLGDESG